MQNHNTNRNNNGPVEVTWDISNRHGKRTNKMKKNSILPYSPSLFYLPPPSPFLLSCSDIPFHYEVFHFKPKRLPYPLLFLLKLSHLHHPLIPFPHSPIPFFHWAPPPFPLPSPRLLTYFTFPLGVLSVSPLLPLTHPLFFLSLFLPFLLPLTFHFPSYLPS